MVKKYLVIADEVVSHGLPRLIKIIETDLSEAGLEEQLIDYGVIDKILGIKPDQNYNSFNIQRLDDIETINLVNSDIWEYEDFNDELGLYND